jgi:hypothetical protein
MGLFNNNRINEKSTNKILNKFSRKRNKIKDASDLEVPNVENMEMTEVDPSTLSEGQFVPNQFVPVEESSSEIELQPQQTIPLSVETLQEQTGQNIGSMFNELAQQNQESTNPYDLIREGIVSSVGDEPVLNEERLKRAKTQALVNAFGNLLQAGVGLQQLQSGNYFQAQPIDNSQVLANLEGVYDDYYKELADYRDRDNKSKLALSEITMKELQAEDEKLRREQDQAFEREKFEYTKERDADLLAFRERESQKEYDLKKDQMEQNAKKLNLDMTRLLEMQLQNDRQFAQFYEKLDRDEQLSAQNYLLKKEELDQLIRRNDNSEISNGIKLVSDGFETLNDTFGDTNYADANITLNSYVELDGQVKDLQGNVVEGDDLARYNTAKKYVSEYNQLLNTQAQLVQRINNQKQSETGVDISNPSQVDINDKDTMNNLGSEVANEFANTSSEFTNKVFGEGKGVEGGLNATNIDFAINYLENKDNFFDIQQGFGWNDEEAEKNRQNLVVKLDILKRRLESLTQ